jgi:hypothetical protein
VEGTIHTIAGLVVHTTIDTVAILVDRITEVDIVHTIVVGHTVVGLANHIAEVGTNRIVVNLKTVAIVSRVIVIR